MFLWVQVLVLISTRKDSKAVPRSRRGGAVEPFVCPTEGCAQPLAGTAFPAVSVGCQACGSTPDGYCTGALGWDYISKKGRALHTCMSRPFFCCP